MIALEDNNLRYSAVHQATSAIALKHVERLVCAHPQVSLQEATKRTVDAFQHLRKGAPKTDDKKKA